MDRRLLTGWSLVRIRPGEPNKTKHLIEDHPQAKIRQIAPWQQSVAAIYKFRTSVRFWGSAGHCARDLISVEQAQRRGASAIAQRKPPAWK